MIIIESALLYTVTVLLTAVLTFVKTNASYGLSDVVSVVAILVTWKIQRLYSPLLTEP